MPTCGAFCAVEIQKYDDEFKMTASQERSSKEGSLKINYGTIATKAIHNQQGIVRLRDDYLDQQSKQQSTVCDGSKSGMRRHDSVGSSALIPVQTTDGSPAFPQTAATPESTQNMPNSLLHRQ